MVTIYSVNNQSLPSTGEASSQKRVAGYADKTTPSITNYGPVQPAGSFRKIDKSGSLQIMRDGLNTMAANIRSADSAYQFINERIGKMKEALEGIVKNYPPFPAGSTERAEMLQKFNGIRNQINRLTLPAEEYGLESMTADLPGMAGTTDIPTLPTDAGEGEIYEALQRLGSAAEFIADQRTALVGMVEKILASIGKSTASPQQYAELKGEITQVKTQSEAEAISLAAQKAFWETSGISRDGSMQLAQLLT